MLCSVPRTSTLNETTYKIEAQQESPTLPVLARFDSVDADDISKILLPFSNPKPAAP